MRGPANEEAPDPLRAHGRGDCGGVHRGGPDGVRRGRPRPRHVESPLGGWMVVAMTTSHHTAPHYTASHHITSSLPNSLGSQASQPSTDGKQSAANLILLEYWHQWREKRLQDCKLTYPQLLSSFVSSHTLQYVFD